MEHVDRRWRTYVCDCVFVCLCLCICACVFVLVYLRLTSVLVCLCLCICACVTLVRASCSMEHWSTVPPPINRTHQIQPVGSLSNTDAIIHSCSLFVATKWQRCQCQCQCHQYSNQHDHFKWFGIGARLLPFWPDHHQVKNPFKGIAISHRQERFLVS